MNQNIKRNAAILLSVLFCGFLLAGCGKPQEGSDFIAGKWEMTEITAGARQVAAQEYMKAADVSRVPTLTFEENGNVTMDMDGQTGNGSWEQDGIYYCIKYTRNGKETAAAVKVEDDALIMEQDGYVLTYEKR